MSKLFPVFIFLLLLTASCSEDEVDVRSETEILTGGSSKTWVYTKRVFGASEAPLNDCEVSEQYTYYADSTYRITHDAPCRQDSTLKNWHISERLFYFCSPEEDCIPAEIIELTDELFRLRFTISATGRPDVYVHTEYRAVNQ